MKKYLPVASILILGFLIRIVSVNQSLWLDEATTAQVVKSFPTLEILTRFAPGDFHPPVYYLFMKAWTLLFGFSEIALRFPSILCGLLLAYIVFQIVKTLSEKNTAIIAMLLTATSPLLVYYSQEARMYMFTAVFVALSVLGLVYIKSGRRTLGSILYIIGIIISLASDYVAIFMMPAFLLMALELRIPKKRVIIINAIAVTGLFPFIPLFVEQFTNGLGVHSSSPAWWGILGGATLKNIVLLPTKFLLGRISFPTILYVPFVGAALSLYLYLGKMSKEESKVNVIFYWLFVPVILAIFASLFVPVLSYFRLLYVVPAICILGGIGILKLDEEKFLPLLGLAIFFNLFFTSRYLYNQEFQRENWRGFAQEVRKTDGSVVVFPANSQKEAYAYYGSPGIVKPVSELTDADSTVWLVRYVQDIFDPEDKTRLEVESRGFVKKTEYDFNRVIVWRYEKNQ